MENIDIHIIGSTILDIVDNCDDFDVKAEDIQEEFEILTKILSKHCIDYSKLRSALSPTASVYSFVFDSDKVKTKGNYISPYITKMVDYLDKKMTAIFLTGDLIFDEKNWIVYSKIFKNHNLPYDYFTKNNVFIIDVINITFNCFNNLTELLAKEDAFLFSMDITKPTIEKYYMTYLLPQKCIKYGNNLIYQVSDQGDTANYTLVDNNENKYRLVPVDDEFAFYTFLYAKPYQALSAFSDLKHSIESIFNIVIESYPKIIIDDKKLTYVKEHANMDIEKNRLIELCDQSIRRNQIFHMIKNVYGNEPEVKFNIPLFYNQKEYLCSLMWNLNSNEARIVTMYYQKKK